MVTSRTRLIAARPIHGLHYHRVQLRWWKQHRVVDDGPRLVPFVVDGYPAVVTIMVLLLLLVMLWWLLLVMLLLLLLVVVMVVGMMMVGVVIVGDDHVLV